MRPGAAVDLAQDALGRPAVPSFTSIFLNISSAKPSRCASSVHDVVVVAALEDRLHDLVAPLQRAVGGGAAAVHLEAGADRQQVGAVPAVGDLAEGGRMRVRDHQQIELLQPLHRFRHAGDGVAAMAEHDHGLALGCGCSVLVLLARITASNQRVVGMPGVSISSLLAKRRLHPVVVDVPDPAPMPPGILVQPVIGGQRGHIEADIGRALHIGMAAEDIGAGAGARRHCRSPAAGSE